MKVAAAPNTKLSVSAVRYSTSNRAVRRTRRSAFMKAKVKKEFGKTSSSEAQPEAQFTDTLNIMHAPSSMPADAAPSESHPEALNSRHSHAARRSPSSTDASVRLESNEMAASGAGASSTEPGAHAPPSRPSYAGSPASGVVSSTGIMRIGALRMNRVPGRSTISSDARSRKSATVSR